LSFLGARSVRAPGAPGGSVDDDAFGPELDLLMAARDDVLEWRNSFRRSDEERNAADSYLEALDHFAGVVVPDLRAKAAAGDTHAAENLKRALDRILAATQSFGVTVQGPGLLDLAHDIAHDVANAAPGLAIGAGVIVAGVAAVGLAIALR
jgi:hypothetical protein